MKVKAMAYIKHNGKYYAPGYIFEIEEKDYERIEDIVEIVEEEVEEKIEEETEGKNEGEPIEEIKKLEKYSFEELKEKAKILGIKGYSKMKKDELIQALKQVI